MNLARKLNQDATYWPVTGSDGYGGFVFGAPAALKVRWQDKRELFITPDLEETASQAIVYLDTDINTGDYLALGDFTTELDPTTIDSAYRVRNYGKVTNLRANQALRKAWL